MAVKKLLMWIKWCLFDSCKSESFELAILNLCKHYNLDDDQSYDQLKSFLENECPFKGQIVKASVDQNNHLVYDLNQLDHYLMKYNQHQNKKIDLINQVINVIINR